MQPDQATIPRDRPGRTSLRRRGRQYNCAVITRGIREFVARDWAAVRESKDAYWAARIARLGPLEAFRVGEALRQQARLNAPSWPDEASRDDDLCAHVRLAELFRRAVPVRRA